MSDGAKASRKIAVRIFLIELHWALSPPNRLGIEPVPYKDIGDFIARRLIIGNGISWKCSWGLLSSGIFSKLIIPKNLKGVDR
jgi:hypothetical protein